MSWASASFLLLRWPHFFGSSWASICTAPAPASSKARTMCMTFSASPKPVSPSTRIARPAARPPARVLEGAPQVDAVQRLAEAGVAVDQDRQARGARHLADEEADLVDRDDA